MLDTIIIYILLIYAAMWVIAVWTLTAIINIFFVLYVVIEILTNVARNLL